MSNVEIVRGFYDALASGDLGGALALLAPDCAWTEMDGFPYGGTYNGPAEVTDGVFKRIGADWEGFAFDLDEIIDGGDTLASVGTYSGTYRATGKPMKVRAVHVWTVRNGKLATFEQFADTLRVAESTH
jgi:ketosteroid isomerase-like protein